jgi:hypothetical protein
VALTGLAGKLVQRRSPDRLKDSTCWPASGTSSCQASHSCGKRQ